MRNYLAVLALLVALGSSVWSTGIDVWGEVTQPDGTTFVYHDWGDEFGGNRETADGYAFVYGSDGWAYYAELDSRGEYRASTHKVGIDDPSSNGIPKNLQRSAASIAEINSVRIAHGYARRPESSVQGTAGAPAHFVCSPTNKCKGYVVLVTFPPETDPKKSFYNGYDQPYGYSWDLFNQFFNGGYDGLAAYKGTTALPRQATSKAAETEAVFGSLRAYFDEVYGGDIIEFEILNKKDATTGLPMWLQLPKTKYDYADLSGGSSTFWNDAEATVRADDTNGDVLNPVPSSTAPSPFPYKTAPASTAATLLANKAIYVYSGLTPTNYSPLHPRVDVTTWSDTNTRGIGARMVMGERQGWEDWGHPPKYKDKEHSVDRFAGIGLHVHEWGHLFGFIHPDGLWEGPNPHSTPQQTNASFDPANLLGWGSMQSGAHGPKIAGQNKDGTPSHYNLAYRSCPNPYNPFYRMDLGWNKKEKITSSMSDKNILSGPAHIYVVPSINGQDYLLDFRTNSTFGQYVGYHRFESSPGLLIWRRASGTADSNPMLIPADGRSIDDARPGGGRDSKDIMFDDLPSDPFAAIAQTYGPTATEATDATHLLHATQKSVGSNKNLRSANPSPDPSYLAFRNITITSDDYGTYASVDIHFIPLPPTTLTASSGSTNSDQVTLRWDTPDRNGDTITGYQYSVDGGDDWVGIEISEVTPIGALTEYIITGLKGTNYTFQVRTVTDGVAPHNVSSSSNEVSLTFDRPGMVTLASSREPSRNLSNLRVGDVLTATATDPNMSEDAWDGDGVSWLWQQRNIGGSSWTGISGARSDRYTLKYEDLGTEVQATVRYNDRAGRDADMAVSEPVVFTGLRVEGATQQLVDEVTDPNATGPVDVGVYTNTDPNPNQPVWSLTGADADYFNLVQTSSNASNERTLQFKQPPNYEVPLAGGGYKTTYAVGVKVQDAPLSGAVGAEDDALSAILSVTVTVTNVEEAGRVELSPLPPQVGVALVARLTDPDEGLTFTGASWAWQRRADAASDWASMPTGAVGATENYPELSSYTPQMADVGYQLQATVSYDDHHGPDKRAVSASTVAVVSANRRPVLTGPTEAWAKEGDKLVTTYRATDPDRDRLTWSLMGTDADDFELFGRGQPRTLRFKHPPDFEQQATYTVTIGVSDGSLSATMDVTVGVFNVEEAGRVALTSTQPQVGTPLTATLSDPDGRITGAVWQWQRRADDTAAWAAVAAGVAGTSGGAELSSYTPLAGDVGYMLQATVRYRDGFTTKIKTAQSAATEAVVGLPAVLASLTAEPGDGQVVLTWQAPANGGSPISSYEYRQREDGGTSWQPDWTPVKDSDAQTTGHTVDGLTNGTQYTFEVRAVNAVGTGAARAATATPERSNQPPTLKGPATANVDEQSTDAIGSYEADDPDDDDLTWSLGGADASAFTWASTGPTRSLAFKTPPDFEQQASYAVSVSVDDGALSATVTTTVSVSNVDEAGTVALTSTQPQVGTPLTATLSDPDGSITGATWQWQRRASATADWADAPAGAEGASGVAELSSYTPQAGDVGLRLQATVRYRDGHSTTATKTAQSATTEGVVGPPAVLASLTAAPGDGQVVLAWQAPASDGGAAISGYEYRQSDDSGTSWQPDWTPVKDSDAQTTGHTVDGLTNGTQYTFEVRAVNAVGKGAARAATATPVQPT